MLVHNTNAVKFGRVGVLARNIRTVHKDFWTNALPDPFVLKKNSLVLSSLLLVGARVIASFKSSSQAKGTGEAHHRQSEAVKTTIREIGGFSLSFLVLRLIESLSKSWFQQLFGLPYELKLLPHTGRHLKDAINASLKGKEIESRQVYIDPDFQPPKDPTKMLNKYKRLKLDSLFLKNKALDLPSDKLLVQATKNVQRFMSYAPTVIGSIPAIFLSGYLLEKFTQKYATDVADKISRKFQKQGPNSDYLKLHETIHNPFQK